MTPSFPKYRVNVPYHRNHKDTGNVPRHNFALEVTFGDQDKAMITTEPRIDIQRIGTSRLAETDMEHLKFGRVFTDHMFVMDYVDGAWKQPVIRAYKDEELSPATLVLHYAQTIFEGMKAYKNERGEVSLFRPQANIARMNRSAARMAMPAIPEDVFLEGLQELVKMDAAWVPDGKDAALYIRPFMYADDEYIGVKPSDGYRFVIFICPVRFPRRNGRHQVRWQLRRRSLSLEDGAGARFSPIVVDRCHGTQVHRGKWYYERVLHHQRRADHPVVGWYYSAGHNTGQHFEIGA